MEKDDHRTFAYILILTRAEVGTVLLRLGPRTFGPDCFGHCRLLARWAVTVVRPFRFPKCCSDNYKLYS